MGEYLYVFGKGKEFLSRTHKALAIKEKANKLDLIKIKNFFPSKNNTRKVKRQPQTGGKDF